MPVRRGAPLRAWRAYRGRAPQRAWLALWAGVLASALVAGSLGTALARTPSLQELDGLSGPTAIGDGNLSQEPPPTPVAPRPAPSRPGNSPTPRPSPVTPPVNTAVDFPPGTGVDLTTGPITAVGDSVLLGAHVAVQRVLPHVLIDAAVNRQSYTVLDRIRARLAAGRLAPVVVIHIGTNGPAVLSDLDSLLRLLSTRTRVVLVNMHAPESWNDSTNRVLARAASQFRNVVLADWAAASAGHREYFVADDTHLTHSGGRAYAAVIAEALGGCRDPVCPR
jgi:proteasome lid subunit RPN8/RPN11